MAKGFIAMIGLTAITFMISMVCRMLATWQPMYGIDDVAGSFAGTSTAAIIAVNLPDLMFWVLVLVLSFMHALSALHDGVPGFIMMFISLCGLGAQVLYTCAWAGAAFTIDDPKKWFMYTDLGRNIALALLITAMISTLIMRISAPFFGELPVLRNNSGEVVAETAKEKEKRRENIVVETVKKAVSGRSRSGSRSRRRSRSRGKSGEINELLKSVRTDTGG